MKSNSPEHASSQEAYYADRLQTLTGALQARQDELLGRLIGHDTLQWYREVVSVAAEAVSSLSGDEMMQYLSGLPSATAIDEKQAHIEAVEAQLFMHKIMKAGKHEGYQLTDITPGAVRLARMSYHRGILQDETIEAKANGNSIRLKKDFIGTDPSGSMVEYLSDPDGSEQDREIVYEFMPRLEGLLNYYSELAEQPDEYLRELFIGR